MAGEYEGRVMLVQQQGHRVPSALEKDSVRVELVRS